MANNVESFAANVNKIVEFLTRFVAAINHINHVWRQNKWRPISLEIAKHLSVTEKLAEVNVKQVATLFNHDVVIVPIADSCSKLTRFFAIVIIFFGA